MKSMLKVCLVALAMVVSTVAQDPSKPIRRPGITVQMPQAPHSAEISAADDENATVVSITANGKVFVGVRPTELSVLSSLNSSTVYLKADARVPYQEVISVFDALQGKTIVLLTAPASEGKSAGIMPPYGLKINQSGE